MRIFIFCILLIIPFQKSVSQIIEAKKITTLDGLPSNKIRSLFTDANQTLWIGTENGIAALKYGVIQEYLVHDSIPFLNCWAITQDANNALWFGSYGNGLVKYKDGKWEVLTIKNGLPSNNIRRLFLYKKKIYIGTDIGLSVIDVNSLKIKNYSYHEWDGEFPHISDFFVDKQELYFTTFHYGVYHFKEGQRASIIKVNSSENIFSVHSFHDSILVSQNNGITKIKTDDLLHGLYYPPKIKSSNFSAFEITNSGNLYGVAWGMYNESGGLFLVNGNKVTRLNKNYGIPSTDLTAISIDRKKNLLYVGSLKDGVYSIDLNHTFITHPSEKVTGILAKKNGVWTLHEHSLDIDFNSHHKRKITAADFIRFRNERGSQVKKQNPNDLYSIRTNSFFLDNETEPNELKLYQIRSSSNGAWVNSNVGVFEINSTGELISYYSSHNFVFNVTKENNIIEAIPYGGVRTTKDLKIDKSFLLDFPNTPDNVLDIASYDSVIFLGSIFTGVYTYQNGRFTSLLKDSILQQHKIRKLFKASKNELWVVTDFGVISQLNIRDKIELLHVISREEIIGSSIIDIAKYKDYALFITDDGLNIYDNLGNTRLIDEEQGLNHNLTCLSVNGSTAFVGTDKGWYSINLESLLKNDTTSTNTYISSLKVNNTVIEYKPTSKALKLPYNQNTVQLFFNTTGYWFPKKLSYQYRLKETQPWSTTFHNSSIVLPYLNNGKYTIQLKVIDANTGQSKVFTLMKLEVALAFYQRWWFYTLSAFLLVVIGLVLNRNRIKKVRYEEKFKAEVQQQLDASKMEALLSQMNPHFIFNAINSIQSFILGNNKEEAMQYLNDFSVLIRQTLNNSNSLEISLDDEIQYLKNYIKIENLRFSNQIECTWNIEEGLELQDYSIPSMILQPFIENVFEHAFVNGSLNQQLTINIYLVENYLTVEIQDNGIGFIPNHKESKPHGLSITKKRLSISNSDMPHLMKVTSNKNTGTTICIQFYMK